MSDDPVIEVVFDPHLRTHSSLAQGLEDVVPFLKSPGVPGIAPLSDRRPAEGVFQYSTVAAVSLAEILAVYTPGDPCGSSSALTVLIAVATALEAVQPAADKVGLHSHGSLNPWRIALGANGEVHVLGYGLPDVELFAYLDEDQTGVSADALRYTPPERLEDKEEDSRADIYSLGLIGAEMMLGRPVFDGRPDEIAERVFNGDAPALIEALGADLGEAMLDLLCVATERRAHQRFRDLKEFLVQANPLVDAAEGPSIELLVERALRRRDAFQDDPPTEVVSKSEARSLAQPGALEDADELETHSNLGDFELIPAVPPPSPTCTLEDLQALARAIVERCAQLAEQADAIQGIAVQRAATSEDVGPVVRKLRDAVGKAHKAASSAANTAKLVELDDTTDDASVTLEMVRSAEKLCFSATTQALEILYRIQADVDDMRAERQALERALRRATEARERSAEAAKQVGEIEEALKQGLTSGRFTTGRVKDAVSAVSVFRSTAISAATRASKAATAAATRGRSVEATRDADRSRSAADEAEKALRSVQEVSRELGQAEADARQAEAGKLRSCVATARSAALAAAQSLERAQIAASQATIPEGSTLLDEIRAHAEASDEAATTCEAAVQPVLEDTTERSPKVLGEMISVARGLAQRSQSEGSAATELSDRLIALAGEAAAAEASQSKLVAKARALLDRADRLAAEVREAWTKLEADTEEVTGRTARDALQVARTAVQSLDTRLLSVRSDVEFLDALNDLEALEDRVQRLLTIETDLEGLANRAVSRCREARGAASRELEEIARRRAARAELNDAITRARGHAERCRAAVESAWTTYRQTVEALAAASVEGADSLRVRAYEIIDIAEFQAGEAEIAAQATATQTDPSEARSHASTAESFEERIRSDLPEAMELLDRAGNLAAEETSRLATARERIGEALEAAGEAVRHIEELRASAREASRGWAEDASVALALSKLEKIGAGLDEDLHELRALAERAGQVESADEAREMAPLAEASARRLTALRGKADTVHATLEAAVHTARTQAETRESALKGAIAGLAAIEAHRATIAERSARLLTSVELHHATSESVMHAVERMGHAVSEIAKAEELAVLAGKGVRAAATASEARVHHQKVEAAVEGAEHCLEQAATAETEGTSAAERDAAERRDTEARQLDHARSTALEHVNTAKIAAGKGLALLAEANPELIEYDDPEVQRLHDKARNWIRVARTAATGSLKAARECQRAKRAPAAMEWEQRASALATDAANAVSEASILLREAVDLARRAEEEAEALKNVKAEIASIQLMVSEGIQQAESDASRIQEITAGSTDPDTLACNDEAASIVNAVRRASAKVQAAAPLALQAESLDAAQGLLKTCRRALERADESADAVRELIQKAKHLLSEEEERAAQRLADARADAERPAQEASSTAERTASWFQIGQQLLADLDRPPASVKPHLEALQSATEDARQLADEAEIVAQPARRAKDLASAKTIGVQVQTVADQAEAAAERARQALDAMRAALDAAVEDSKQASVLQLQAAEEAAAAEVSAADATSIAEALEKHISESSVSDDEAAMAFREVKRAAKAVAAAAAAAFEATETALGQATSEDVTQTLAAIKASRQTAEQQLAEVRRHERTCRETIDSVQRRVRDEAKRAKDEALRAKLRRKRNESKAIDREALRKRFQERESREKPNLSALRERLRARRRGDHTGSGKLERRPPARPERDSDSQTPPRTRRRPGPDAMSETQVDGPAVNLEETLEPQALDVQRGRSPEERTASRRRREERKRQRGERPDGAPEPDSRTDFGLINPSNEADAPTTAGSESADALLRRLRRNRKPDEF